MTKIILLCDVWNSMKFKFLFSRNKVLIGTLPCPLAFSLVKGFFFPLHWESQETVIEEYQLTDPKRPVSDLLKTPTAPPVESISKQDTLDICTQPPLARVILDLALRSPFTDTLMRDFEIYHSNTPACCTFKCTEWSSRKVQTYHYLWSCPTGSLLPQPQSL